MFIAHLPGAYLALKSASGHIPKAVFFWGLVGSVLPDIDLLLFYFWDNRAFHHHDYLTHRPAFWAAMLGVGLVLFWVGRSRPASVLTGLGIGGLIHMVLDCIAGNIAWAWPVSDVAVPFVVVPATHSHWILSFLTHWTFAVELVICAIAAIVFYRSRQKPHRDRP